MQKLFLKLVSLLLIIIIFNVLFILFVKKIYAFKNNDYLSSMIAKHKTLENMKSKKIIFIGGSNLAFSQDSCSISKSAKKPVINMGLHGGLGLNYMMEEIKDNTNKGDTVIIVPEYDNFFDVYDGDITLAMLIMDHYPQGIRYLNSPKQYSTFPQYLISFLQTNAAQFKDILAGKIAGVLKHDYPVKKEDPIYKKDAFNECGDLVSHLDKKSTYQDNPNDIFKERSNPNFDEKSFGGIYNFAAYMHNKGVRVILTFPTIPKDQYDKYQPFFEELGDRIKKIKNITIPNDPSYYVMGDEMFYDSNYHLNKDGRERRTELVIDDMKKLGIIK